MGLVHQYDIISDLRAALSGRVIMPDDTGYDTARTNSKWGVSSSGTAKGVSPERTIIWKLWPR